MPLTGYLHGNKCYDTQAAAGSAFFAQTQQLWVTPGATPYTAQLVFDTATNAYRFQTFSVATNGLWTTRSNVAQPYPQFPRCDPTESYFDGLAVGWLIVTLMVTAWGFTQMRKAAR